MNGTIGGKLRYWFNMLGYWIVVGSWFCNRWRKKWFSLCGMRNVNHPRRPKCMVSAALAAWIVLGSWFCNRWRKKWLQSRGVSNALALPWAKPWLQLCDVDNERYTTTSDYGCLETALARILHGSTFRTRLQVTKATAGSLRTCRSRHACRLNRMHRHCLEKSRRESEKLSSAARWLGHCVAGAEWTPCPLLRWLN